MDGGAAVWSHSSLDPQSLQPQPLRVCSSDTGTNRERMPNRGVTDGMMQACHHTTEHVAAQHSHLFRGCD